MTQEEVSKRKPGRPKGSPNKSTATIRMAILQADPVGFLVEIMHGKKAYPHTIINEKTGSVKTISIVPNVGARKDAAKWLGERIVPAMKSVEFKDDDGTIKNAFAAALAAMTKK